MKLCCLIGFILISHIVQKYFERTIKKNREIKLLSVSIAIIYSNELSLLLYVLVLINVESLTTGFGL